ncbi:bifunctional folylpolyglutamate synthase/dihydrofolate synthase [Campylobacter sp. MIT 99-7217]|uniref:Mur ligase family protein n=1 Tax=Campylobacter sp. MIT 99-7217 TaxID=535091 RepID=UPI00115A05C6|nr:Mur ligase family protein [Campylobacter sp. MIT 99-7217]TQR33682.1 bifunctional folylpolyglutamate synthase/dihydrofolate synthase [Campylobacter sp. MIT 99-7217]
MNKTFLAFLETKSQNYDKIDRFRAFRFFEKYKQHFKLKPIIHIIGTNGKGSTGRFLTQLLLGLGFKVGHYTSPHIFKFNERFYFNGKIASDELLNKTHEKLKNIFKDDLEKLSYFEYATFLAALMFEECEFVIFEAGIGGEYDATSLFEKRLSIFTKIGFDHMQILGSSLKEISRTKLKVMSKEAIISHEQEQITLDLALKIALLKNAKLSFLNESLNENLLQGVHLYQKKYPLVAFLKHNLLLACASLNQMLGQELCLKALERLGKLDLRGRCEKIAENIYIDVGHNEMAAQALADELSGEKVVLIYNAFMDKDIFSILRKLKPIIAKISIYNYKSEERKLANKTIKQACEELEIKCEEFQTFDKNEKYLVFGSFVLVENFLRGYIEKTKSS